MKKLYPDAKFIYLKRSAEANIKSLMNAWNAKKRFQFRYRTYLNETLGNPEIKGYDADVWKFAMPKDFENYWQGKTLEEVCEFQYRASHEAIDNSLSKSPLINL